jgi:hypothetical protein
MRITRGLLAELDVIAEDYTGQVILHCMDGQVKKVEHTVTTRPDNSQAVSIPSILRKLDSTVGLVVERTNKRGALSVVD